MSAKINVETDDPILASVLGSLIVKALEEAKFTALRSKIVMVYHPYSQKPGNATATHLIARGQPELKPHYHVVEESASFTDLIQRYRFFEKSAHVFDKPIVLSFQPDTCEDYEQQAAYFLEHGKDKPVETQNPVV